MTMKLSTGVTVGVVLSDQIIGGHWLTVALMLVAVVFDLLKSSTKQVTS